MREQNAFQMAHNLPILRSELMEYIYPKLFNATIKKLSVMSASDYTDIECGDVQIFMQLTQGFVLMWNFDDMQSLINNSMF